LETEDDHLVLSTYTTEGDESNLVQQYFGNFHDEPSRNLQNLKDRRMGEIQTDSGAPAEQEVIAPLDEEVVEAAATAAIALEL